MNWKHAAIAAAGIGTGLAAAGTAAAGFAAWSYVRRRGVPLLTRRRGKPLEGEVVVITGGSRGLGLLLAREFAVEGCRLAICARDGAELDRAKAELRGQGAEVFATTCDVADREQVRRAMDEIAAHYGRIDILVNNAGIIQVGPFGQMAVEDFELAMDVMFWGTLYSTLAVLPAMRSRGAGRIVNITSVGGKVSVPHLLPYSCAKFATVALSEGLRTELGPQGIRVTTIVPGLMRTGSYVRAITKGDHKGEFTWFRLASATPVLSISAERAARSIVAATKKGTSESILSVPANILARIHGAFPELVAPALSLANRLLPS